MLLFWECSEAGRVAGTKRSTIVIWSLPSKYKLCLNFCNTEVGKNGHLKIKTMDSSQAPSCFFVWWPPPQPPPHCLGFLSHGVAPALSNKVSQHFTKIKRDCFPRQGPSATWMFPLVPTPSASPWHGALAAATSTLRRYLGKLPAALRRKGGVGCLSLEGERNTKAC